MLIEGGEDAMSQSELDALLRAVAAIAAPDGDESQEQTERTALVRFLKTLANESRLALLGHLSTGERSVGELAGLLKLTEPTISYHLGLMTDLGIVSMRQKGNTHLYRVNGRTLGNLNRELYAADRKAATPPDLDGTEWERHVLQAFLDGERLREIPASLRKRIVILRWLANRFEENRRYPESEVNMIINRHHEDHATLRRELVDYSFMERDHGVYRRVPDAERIARNQRIEGARDALE
jgi:DNA-binding transcriptional ArsR family regulator